MVEIIKTCKKAAPAMRFIGKKYGDEDRVNGFFDVKWSEWFENGWFDMLDNLGSPEGWDNTIGLMGYENGMFKYWIGKFTHAETPAPEGFDYIDYNAGDIGICRLKGHEDVVYGNEPMCYDHLQAEGYEIMDKEFTCFERYLICDETVEVNNLDEGDTVVDICFFLKENKNI